MAFALDAVSDTLVNGTTGPNGTIGHCGDGNVFASLEDWVYTRNTTASCLIHSALMETDFEGLSVRNEIIHYKKAFFLKYLICFFRVMSSLMLMEHDCLLLLGFTNTEIVSILIS